MLKHFALPPQEVTMFRFKDYSTTVTTTVAHHPGAIMQTMYAFFQLNVVKKISN